MHFIVKIQKSDRIYYKINLSSTLYFDTYSCDAPIHARVEMTRDNHWTVYVGLGGCFTASAVWTLPVVSPHFDYFAVFGTELCRLSLQALPHQKIDDDNKM
jgi:hypothetical protein